jgi:thiol:disulfide interchange protein DsbD
MQRDLCGVPDWCAIALALAATGFFTPTSVSAGDNAWRTDLEAARSEAAKSQRPLLIEMTATWCGACRQMQQLTLRDPAVLRTVESACVAVLVDVDQHPDAVSTYSVTAFPTTLLVDPAGTVLKRWVGYQPASEFAAELERLCAGGKPSEPDRFGAVSAIYPANSSPRAFGGYCLVSLLEDNKLRRGQLEVAAEYRGQAICFASHAHRERFFRNPERYWPAANGTCVVTRGELHTDEPGDPRVGVTWRGKLWFFADRDRQQRFIQSPRRFSIDRL